MTNLYASNETTILITKCNDFLKLGNKINVSKFYNYKKELGECDIHLIALFQFVI